MRVSSAALAAIAVVSTTRSLTTSAFAPAAVAPRLARLPAARTSAARRCRPLARRPVALSAGAEGEEEKPKSKLPMLLDPGTRGGATFVTLAPAAALFGLFFVLNGSGQFDVAQLSPTLGVGFTLVVILGWTGSYLFRVANKDMTCVLPVPPLPPLLLRAASATRCFCYARPLLHTATQMVLLLPTNSPPPLRYAVQLKDYEDAVIQKRLEELDETEVDALLIEMDNEESAI